MKEPEPGHLSSATDLAADTASGAEEETASGVEEETASGVEEETVSRVEEETVSGVEEEAVSGIEEETVSGIEEGTASGVEEETASGVEKEIAFGVEAETASNVEEEIAFRVEAETVSNVEEAQTSAVPPDHEGVKLSEASKLEAQTTQVQEVEWSNFGAQGSFASFSDFLSVFPADSSQPQDVNALASNPEADFFSFSNQPSSGVGSNAVEQEYDDASFFNLHQPYLEGRTQTAEVPRQVSQTLYEPQAPLHVESEERPAQLQSQGLEKHAQSAQFDQDRWHSVQSQGQEQQAQSDQSNHGEWKHLQSQGQVQQTQFGQPDQGLWQELAEYPGWLYNTLTGEWVEKINHDPGTGSSWNYSTGQDHAQDPALENQSSQWQGHENQTSQGQCHENQTSQWQGHENQTSQWQGHENQTSQWQGHENQTSQWQGHEGTVNSFQRTSVNDASHLGQSTASVPLNEGTKEENGTAQTDKTHNPLFEETLVQQNESVWQESTGDFSSGQTQSRWEDQYPGWYYDHHAQEWKEYSQTSQAPVLSPLPLVNEQPLSASLPAVSYDQSTYSNTFSQGFSAGGWSATQDPQYNAGGNYFQDAPVHHNGVAGPSQNDSLSSTNAQIPGQWTGGQRQQFDNSSSSYQSGQLQSNGANQLSEFMPQKWDASYNAEQVDSRKQSQLVPESQYNPYGSAQLAGYTSQSWPAMNSYEQQRYPQYVSQTPPNSVEEAMRTSLGRPPHNLASFGFGGKLVIMKLKDPLSLQSSNGLQSVSSGQAFVPGPIHVHSLSQLVAQTVDNGRGETGSLYFGALSRSTVTGPLVGGSVSSKDLSKWLDDRAVNCQSEESNFRSSDSLSILWGLLKLACKHYGKLRSQPGSAGITSQEEDGAEAALATLLTSGGDQSSWTMGSFSSTVCLQGLPSEHQLQVTASEVKKLLVAGKRKEALRNAQQGQLWGPALLLARQLGEKYYADTVAEMAQRQFLPGSPLRTLSLLLAGQPAEVFSGNSTLAAPIQQPMQVPSSSGNSTEGGLGSMLEEWQENLSIMAANRTNGDDRVISHLGDCLWKVKGEVAAAHICYLVADANFEAFSSNARLCLVGADHWKNPRTYATPEAIQRTEVYEYAKILGNPQFILLPFQPYKIIYASMLAEAGKTTEALRYCQAVLKTLKTASRAPEVETCRLAAASLEERLRFYAQGGSSVNLAPGKLVSGLLRALDRGIHGIIGGPPLPTAQEQLQLGPAVESVPLQAHPAATHFGASPSRLPAYLGPSASAEKLKESAPSMPQRSVSEPDFSATMKEKAEQGKPTTRGGYLHRFGSVFSKAGGIVSMVSKTSKKEAKLGDKNTFYYDEKLKMWVEEGAATPQEEAALAPPPMSANFVSKVEDSSPDAQFGVGLPPASASGSKSAYLGTPPVPPSNQFSARARQQGVRSRYVDTFNKGGNSTTPSKLAVSAFAPAGRDGGTPLQPMNFFVPGSSLDSSNGSVSSPENGIALGSSEENHFGHYSEPASNMQECLDANQHLAVQNVFHQSGMVGSGRHPLPNSDNTSAFGTDVIQSKPSSDNSSAFAGGSEPAEGSGRLGRIPGNGNIGFSNGYHSRANSWSGYPSNFQTSHTETSSSHDNSAADFSMYNGFSNQSTMNAPSTVGSYFPSPPKVDIYNPNINPGMNETFALASPSLSPFLTTTGGGELRPIAVEARGGSPADIALVGDDLQEVEL